MSSRTKTELLFSILIVLLLAWAVWEARNWSPRVRFFPWVIGVPALAVALVQLGFALRGALATRPGPTAADGSEPFGSAGPEVAVAPEVARRRAIAILAWTLAFFTSILLLGFRVGPALVAFGFLRFGAREGWKTSAVTGLVIYSLFLILSESGVLVFPSGSIAESLGLQSLDSYVVTPILNAALGR